MPTISVFYGITIRMYQFDDQQHHLPHIHVASSNESAVFRIDDAEIIAGSFHRHKRKLVQAWIEIHKEELMQDWKLAISGEPLFKIEPLK